MKFILVALTSVLLAIELVAAEPRPGQSVFGEKEYAEYIVGDLPIVISAPHGGRLAPDEIPDRTSGTIGADANTQELVRAIAAEIHARTGHHAHVIICRLHRRKLDCNREIVEAAAGNPIAEKTWAEYHAFIERAEKAAIAKAGRCFYIDLHGQGHKDRRIELGYLHTQEVLAKADAELNAEAAVGSLRRIAEKAKRPYVELLRGPRSLGAMLEAHGFPSAPSPERPVPVLPFFAGGYSTRRHVPADAPVAGLQIECNLAGVRDTAANRERFATALVTVLREYLAEHWHLKL
jgi:hypothetical protein